MIYIESTRHLWMLSEVLNLAAKPKSWLDKEYLESAKALREFKRTDWSHVDSWDCGRQDAFGDRVDAKFKRHRCLVIARHVQKGRGDSLKTLCDKVLGL